MKALDGIKARIDHQPAYSWPHEAEMDRARLFDAIEGVISYLDDHEQRNPFGREQWNADIRAKIEAALKEPW
jgi:hypothetical protein